MRGIRPGQWVGAGLAIVACGILLVSMPGRATRPSYEVFDGDTVRVARGEVCRLLGIDAPEASQPLAKEAAKALSELMQRGVTRVDVVGTDRYGRSLCVLWLDSGHTVNAELVRQGMAEVYRGRGGDPSYAGEERAAKQARRGIWSLACYESPSAYRRRTRAQPESAGPCRL